MNEEILKLFWGKTVKDKEGKQLPDVYHPVLFHLLDVGHCAALLWDECLSTSCKKALARALDLSEAELRHAVVFLAAWHDIGKVAPGFQFQNFAPKFGPQFLWQRLQDHGFQNAPISKPHAQVSARALIDSLKNGTAGWQVPNAATALIWAHIAGAHHGTFPHSGEIAQVTSDVLGNDLWQLARLEMMKISARLLLPETPLETLQTPAWPDENGGAVGWLAGLISVADWLGSSEHFPAAGHQYENLPTAQEYSRLAAQRAQNALHKFGWLPSFIANDSPLDFKTAFGFAPNVLQQAVQRCAQNPGAPFFAIAEAPMGIGKTEAAFTAIDVTLRSGLANGFYIALPTQATSNAMHDRVRDNYLGTRQNHNKLLNLQLAHSGALLKDSGEEPRVEFQPASVNEDGNKTEATIAAQSWFSARKRPLLAPFGVGTIDQSLMGVLQTKHWFVRVFGLANKVIVFDEVHAYDTYMSTLLDRLLSWLHANHCSVILLSATLPSSRRRQLIEAWGGALPENKVSYPRLTWIDERGTQSLSIAEPQEKTESKIVHLADAPGDGSTLAATLKNKLNDGGCAAIICNTVKSAQALYAHLKAELGEDFCDQDEWHLFHARMPFAWRQEREAKILKSFGKDKTHRAQRAIAISTQVMEQSLDLDFDWMASELAPIDLLLQRAGRLHRHAHTVRPAALQEAELMVLCDAGENGAPPRLDVPDAMYAHFILLQTWLALRARAGVLRLPDDIETLIEVVYETCLPAPDQVWEEALKTTWDAMHSSRREANAKARNVLIHKPQDARSIANAPSRELREDDDPETHQTLRAATREGDPSLQVVCLVREGDALYLPSNDGSADRAQPVDLQRNPHRDQTRALLRNALPLSNKALYFALLAEAAPTGWKENAHLRFARALEFCEGQTRIAGRTLRLDGELGLVIEKNQ